MAEHPYRERPKARSLVKRLREPPVIVLLDIGIMIGTGYWVYLHAGYYAALAVMLSINSTVGLMMLWSKHKLAQLRQELLEEMSYRIEDQPLPRTGELPKARGPLELDDRKTVERIAHQIASLEVRLQDIKRWQQQEEARSLSDHVSAWSSRIINNTFADSVVRDHAGKGFKTTWTKVTKTIKRSGNG